MRKSVLVGMSGGVDSSVAAALLLDAGYDVAGATLCLRGDDTAGGCSASDDVGDARRVARHLGIPHHVFDMRSLFRSAVIDPFVAAYEQGRTPNPCVVCNRHIKFGALLEEALGMGFDFVATGHYAHVEQSLAGRWLLKKAPHGKDQSYVLHSLTQHQLSHLKLPLAGYTKEEIRRLAEGYRLPVARKAESQDICFIPDGDYAAFIESYTGHIASPGDFVDQTGRVIGRHKGIIHYTVGQRKGLGMSFGEPMYVIAIDAARRQVVLAPAGQEYARSLMACDINWIPFDDPPEELRAEVMARYRGAAVEALLTPLPGGCVRALFDTPLRAVTPGQAAVFYEGEYVIGGGTITGADRA